MSTPRVLVAQLGARRHYLVPRSLLEGGHLEHFCTDVYFGRRPWVDSLVAGVLSRRTGGFAARQHPMLPLAMVSDFPSVSIAAMARRGSPCNRWIATGKQFGASVVRRGFGSANTAFAFSSAALEIFMASQNVGVLRVLDHATAPRDLEMAAVAREEARFPGWASAPAMDDPGLPAYAERQRQERALADRILCGSRFVAEALAADPTTDPTKLRVVPLGIALTACERSREDRSDDGRLRVLFVGNEGLRKGLGYLLEALALLRTGSVRLRVAGDPGFSAVGIEEIAKYADDCRSVQRNEIRGWYRWADVLVLPSVSDTFGMAILEAMAAGIPVIASTSSGGPDVIRHGVDGWIVPSRDAEAIADKLEELAVCRRVARQMGEAARERAAEFSVEAYGTRLLNAIAA